MGRDSGADLFRGITGRLRLKRPLTPPPASAKTGTLDFFRDLAGRDSTRHTSEIPAEIRRSYARHRQVADRLRIPFDDHLYYLLAIGYAKRDRIISSSFNRPAADDFRPSCALQKRKLESAVGSITCHFQNHRVGGPEMRP